MGLSTRISKLEKEFSPKIKGIPSDNRVHVISSASQEEAGSKIESIKKHLFEEFGTTEGVFFVDTGILRPGG